MKNIQVQRKRFQIVSEDVCRNVWRCSVQSYNDQLSKQLSKKDAILIARESVHSIDY